MLQRMPFLPWLPLRIARYCTLEWPSGMDTIRLQLRNVLEAIGNVDSDPPASLKLLKGTFQSPTGQALDISRWQDSLYERLSGNEVAYQIADALLRPRSMGDLVEDLSQSLDGRCPKKRCSSGSLSVRRPNAKGGSAASGSCVCWAG
jgi:hypothetical protein